ncbi:hypothetical protein NC653_018133 [Populus alba x Populus x berolinensis]|uniref:Uncharacterized protein n=1 Tax=Populus alba x Populus x berolinensis TaxID=444605 RepID=A0AAD6QRW3_9ROSI|nr:hypothetical protein NC653_018133 [Populus alba x Populus x berolinensis]
MAASSMRLYGAGSISPRTTRTSTPSRSCAGAIGSCSAWRQSIVRRRPQVKSRVITSTSPPEQWSRCTSGPILPRNSAR